MRVRHEVHEPSVEGGLVVGQEVLIVTNFITSFKVLTELSSISDRTIRAERTLVSVLDRGPDTMRLGCAISGEAIYEWFDQAAPGWAVQRTTPSGKTEYEWHTLASVEARRKGMKEGTPEFQKFVDDDYQRRLEELEKIVRPQERAEINRYLDYMRGLVKSVGFFIGEHDGVELGLRVELEAAGR